MIETSSLFDAICKYFPQVALCGFCYAEILFRVFEILLSVPKFGIIVPSWCIDPFITV